ncbi:hypothetical protein [Brevundimonas sp.]
MSAVERIWLIQTPSALSQAWRDVLRETCTERGWDFAIHERGQTMPVATPGRSLLVVAWLDQAEGIEVTNWSVQLSPPLDVVALLQSSGELSEHDALYEASLRLATAWDRIKHGASEAWWDDEELEIVGLGRIRRPQGHVALAPLLINHPLSMFERDNQKDNRGTQWRPDLFLYPGLPSGAGIAGSLSLVGRRRLLFNGPNIFLPSGSWNFIAEISIDPPGRTELVVEWGHGHEVASLVAPINSPGRYELQLEKRWESPRPADFRISLMIPALEGDFIFHGGTVSPALD